MNKRNEFSVINEILTDFDLLNDPNPFRVQAARVAIPYAAHMDGLEITTVTEEMIIKYFDKLYDEMEFSYDAETEVYTSYFKNINLVVNFLNVPKNEYLLEVTNS